MRIGILGAAWIAPEAVVKPARELDGVEVVAVGARERERAEDFAARWRIPHALTGYDAVIERSDIDVVYIPLPVSAHTAWAIRAAQAGKHVLVEKPFSMDSPDAERMVEAADREGVVMAEAFHYAYHPAMRRVRELVSTGALGRVREIEATFAFDVTRDGITRPVYLDPVLGGGALYHAGSYCLHFCRSAIASEPRTVRSEMRLGHTGADLGVQADVTFPGGVVGRLTASLDADRPQMTATVAGNAGSVELRAFVAPHLLSSAPIRMRQGDAEWEERPNGGSTYLHQLIALRDAVCHGEPMLTSGRSPVESMKALDLVRRSAIRHPAPVAR